jgi:hypothetical protein
MNFILQANTGILYPFPNLPLFFLGLHFVNKKEVVELVDEVVFLVVYKTSSQAPSLSMD